jgi:hypothetical protein
LKEAVLHDDFKLRVDQQTRTLILTLSAVEKSSDLHDAMVAFDVMQNVHSWAATWSSALEGTATVQDLVQKLALHSGLDINQLTMKSKTKPVKPAGRADATGTADTEDMSTTSTGACQAEVEEEAADEVVQLPAVDISKVSLSYLNAFSEAAFPVLGSSPEALWLGVRKTMDVVDLKVLECQLESLATRLHFIIR